MCRRLWGCGDVFWRCENGFSFIQCRKLMFDTVGVEIVGILGSVLMVQSMVVVSSVTNSVAIV